MISVDPIRDEQKIQTMKSYLKGKNVRDYALFVVGINVALRITDLLALKWGDVLDEKGKFKEIRLFEGKTKKERRIQLNRPSQRALRELLGSLDGYSTDDYLFRSREGAQKALLRQQALNILKKTLEEKMEDEMDLKRIKEYEADLKDGKSETYNHDEVMKMLDL